MPKRRIPCPRSPLRPRLRLRGMRAHLERSRESSQPRHRVHPNCGILRALLRGCWRSIFLFRVAGVPVSMHTTSLVYPCGFIAWVVLGHPWFFHGGSGYVMEAFAVLLLLDVLWGSLLVHEFAHVLVARLAGVGTESVILTPFGAAAILERPLRNAREFWIAAGGPVASLVLAGCFWMLLHGHPVRIDFRALPPPMLLAVRFGLVMNMAVAIFNLLPCFPMDGGRMLRSLLAVAIGMVARVERGRAFVMASRIVVRFVNPVAALSLLLFTVLCSHDWLHLVLLPLLLLAAEVEHRALCEEDHDSGEGDNDVMLPRPRRRIEDS